MQTLTLFFGIAIVAIAIENFTANFLPVKSSGAGAKGDQGIFPRDVKNGQVFYLRGVTGTEKVIIRDGDNVIKRDLKKENQQFTVTKSKITIEYTNDQCCKPDKNVMFTAREGLPYKISTNDNEVNYFKNWNCSIGCLPSNGAKIKKQVDLQSRTAKADRCQETRVASVDDCTKCSLVKGGQFCYPGNYTVEFRTEGQCTDVTFGGCNIPQDKYVRWYPSKDEAQCVKLCNKITRCNNYRFIPEQRNCTMWFEKYRDGDCNTRAAPMDTSSTECLFNNNDNICDSLLEEDCEYHGKDLFTFTRGDVDNPDTCFENCKDFAPDCKYWIYHDKEKECILKRSGEKTCKIKGGEKMTLDDYYNCKHHPYVNEKE